MAATPAWLAALEAVLNRGIQASERATGLARRLHGTALRVDALGLASVRASVLHGKLCLAAAQPARHGAPADAEHAVISGSPYALYQLAKAPAVGGERSADTGSTRAAGATIRGDAELANSYRQLFAAARPDFEEELSRLLGDLPARRLARLASRTAAWARTVRRTAGENIAEYLQEESRDLVNGAELDDFLHGVDAAREAVDRIGARLALLEQRLKGPH